MDIQPKIGSRVALVPDSMSLSLMTGRICNIPYINNTAIIKLDDGGTWCELLHKLIIILVLTKEDPWL